MIVGFEFNPRYVPSKTRNPTKAGNGFLYLNAIIIIIKAIIIARTSKSKSVDPAGSGNAVAVVVVFTVEVVVKVDVVVIAFCCGKHAKTISQIIGVPKLPFVVNLSSILAVVATETGKSA